MEYPTKRLHTRKNMSTFCLYHGCKFVYRWCVGSRLHLCPWQCGKRRKTNKGGGCMVVPSWWPCASNRGSSVPVWTTRNAWQAGVKTFRQQVGIHGQENRKIPSLWSGWRKVMMPHVMFRSDWKTYGCNILGSEWESYASSWYNK